MPVTASVLLRDAGAAKGAEARQHLDILVDHLLLTSQILGDRARESCVSHPVQGMSDSGQIAARELVFALRAGFDAGEAMADRPVDRLIIAEFEVQERVVLGTAPVAPVERFASDEVERARYPATVAPCKHQQDVIAQGLLDPVEEAPRQVGGAPLAAAGVLIEAPEGRPVFGLQRIAGQNDDLAAEALRTLALLADRFALAR